MCGLAGSGLFTKLQQYGIGTKSTAAASVSTSKVSTVWKRAAEVEWKLKVDLYKFQTVEVSWPAHRGICKIQGRSSTRRTFQLGVHRYGHSHDMIKVLVCLVENTLVALLKPPASYGCLESNRYISNNLKMLPVRLEMIGLCYEVY